MTRPNPRSSATRYRVKSRLETAGNDPRSASGCRNACRRAPLVRHHTEIPRTASAHDTARARSSSGSDHASKRRAKAKPPTARQAVNTAIGARARSGTPLGGPFPEPLATWRPLTVIISARHTAADDASADARGTCASTMSAATAAEIGRPIAAICSRRSPKPSQMTPPLRVRGHRSSRRAIVESFEARSCHRSMTNAASGQMRVTTKAASTYHGGKGPQIVRGEKSTYQLAMARHRRLWHPFNAGPPSEPRTCRYCTPASCDGIRWRTEMRQNVATVQLRPQGKLPRRKAKLPSRLARLPF